MPLNTKPYPFQRDAACRVEQFGGRALLAMEMGLGKSLVSLLWAYRNPDVRPVVVVCPASIKWNWEREAAKHLSWPAAILEGRKPPESGRFASPHSLLVINYDILRDWLPYLLSIRPQLIIFDECHYLVNRKAKRSRAAKTLAASAPHVLGLSGTPLVNRPSELWSVLNLIRPDLYPSFWPFAENHCSPVLKPWGWDFNGACNLDALHARLVKTMMVRCLKKDVLKDLPEKQLSVVPLPLDDAKEYKHAVADFLGWLAKQSVAKARRAAGAEALTKLGYLKRLAAKLKLRSVMEWVDDFLADNDGKLVVFAIHREIIDALRQRYAGLCVVVDGSVVGRDRQLAVDKFQRDRGTRLFVGNIRAAGVGITLTAANTVAFAEIDWTPGAHKQAEDRCHRIGSTGDKVSIYYLVARDSIEEKLCQILQQKQTVLDATLDGKTDAPDLDVFDRLTKALREEPPPPSPRSKSSSSAGSRPRSSGNSRRGATGAGFR